MKFEKWRDGTPYYGLFFEEAYQLALRSPGIGHGKFRHGAVVPRKVGGFNSLKTHPYLAKYSEWPFQHAECSCILKHGIQNFHSKDSMYVLRVGKDGHIRNSKPCKMCQSMLLETDIGMVYYSMEDGYGQLNLNTFRKNLNV